MGSALRIWLITGACLALSVLLGFLTACESAAVELTEVRVRRLLAENNKKARVLTSLLERPGRFVSANIISRSCLIASICALGTHLLYPVIKNALAKLFYIDGKGAGYYGITAVSFALAVLAIVVVVTALAVALPKRLCTAGKIGERFILSVSGVYSMWIALFMPIVLLTELVARGVLRLFGIKGGADSDTVTEEEILMMVDAVNETGGIEESQAEMISNIFEFDDIEIGEVMTHRTEVAAIEESAPIREAVELAIESGFSRIPVYKDSIDDIQGVIYAKDLLTLVFNESAEDRTVRDFMREVVFAPESQKCGELFKELTAQKIQMAVAVDEYGGTAGVVTLEDLIETIVGKIEDEYDDEPEEITKISEGVFEIEGNADYEEVMKALGKEPDDNSPFETIGAMVIELLGHIPEDGERAAVTWENVRFSVTEAEDRKIGRIRAELC